MASNLVRPAGLAPRALIEKVLELPQLVTAVRALPPATLGALVRHVGLEDSAELIALATPEQLVRVLDDDVWNASGPGASEAFDAERFGLWLAVLLESGEAIVAEKLLTLPEELVTLGMSQLLLVLDMDDLGRRMAALDEDENDQLEKALDSCLCEELDQFRLVSRHAPSWDAVLSAILALDRDHHDFVVRLLERLCAASSEQIEDNGSLYDVLTSEEMLGADAAAEREDRRAAEGYVAPAAARSFLSLARSRPVEELLADAASDPVTRAWFRELDRERSAAVQSGADARAARPLVALLRKAGVEVPAPRALPAPKGTRDEPAFQSALRRLAAADPTAHAQRLDELAFLVNVLLADARARGRSLGPLDATEAVVAICSLGLERAGAAERSASFAADRCFRIGLRLLHERGERPAEASFDAARAAALRLALLT